MDQKGAALIEEGRELLTDDFGCTDCHRFHDEGSLGNAPDLTAYGSREWTIAIINNAAQRRFYRDTNDRMPAYAEFPDNPAKNTLSPKDIALLADWLRGEWLEGEAR